MLTGIKVIVADDTMIAREGWKRILETADDIEVIAEVSQVEILPQKVSELSPDIVITDLVWYGDASAGINAIEEIKNKNSKVKIIAVTAYEALIRGARRAGVDATLTKTFSRDDLIRLIRELSSGTFAHDSKDEHITSLKMSSRELEIITLLAEGRSDKEISEILGIGTATTKNHIKSIFNKLNTKNRTQAVHIARDNGLIP